MKKLSIFLLSLGVMSFLVSLIPAQTSQAVNGSDFRAGRIIDDVIFYNKGTMNVQQIQNFLNSKVPTCDRNGTLTYSGTTRAQWGATHGNPAPYTCLKDYYENPTTHENNLEGRPIPAGGVSAAQIIWDAAQAYNINPQSLLVLLQKEQTLVTDDWPFVGQYRAATGQGCPDTVACDSQYYGFYNQVFGSARQFRRYANLPNNYNYIAGANNQIRWSPNVSCGSGTVFIANQATAGLYNYTPYQPNQAALNNLYGTGDGCSAYGNRNFWRTFNDWFGTTLADFKWVTNGYLIKDENGQQADPGYLMPGTNYTATLQATNTGLATWYRGGPNPVLLATNQPTSRNSQFCNNTWIACNRPTLLNEDSVAPGQSGTFTFRFTAPMQVGRYGEYFKPVAEMLSWFNDSPPYDGFGIRVVSPGTFSWTANSYTIKNKSGQSVEHGSLQPGVKYDVTLTATNTGTATWHNSGPIVVNLATSGPTGRSSQFCSSQWSTCWRPTTLQEPNVAPGQQGHFVFETQAPLTLGGFREYFKPVAENFTWFNDVNEDGSFGGWVVAGTYKWSTTGFTVRNQSNQVVNAAQLQPGVTYTATIDATNTGTATWTNNGPTPVTLAASNPTSRNSALCHSSWLACNRPAYLTEGSVAPGQTGHFTFTFTAPNTPGEYREWFKPVAEFLSWFNDAPFNEVGSRVVQ